MAVVQSRSKPKSWWCCVGEGVVRAKVGSSGGKCWGKADSVFFLPEVPSVSGDDTASC